MPRNGSGTYSLPAGNPVVTGTTISSTTHNNTMSDVATALTNSLAKDGQTTPTTNLPMGGFKLTGMGTGSASTDSATLGQIQAQAYLYLASVSGTNTITASTSPVTAAYAAGQTFRFVAAATNTGAVTININSLGAKSITKNGTTALVAGDIVSGGVYQITYDGTQFQLGSVFSAFGMTAQTPVLNDYVVGSDTSGSNANAKFEVADILGLLRGYIAGLTLSTAGSSATMSIAAGVATDSTSAEFIQLSSAISKTTSSWAVGTAQGGLDTGAIANSTWYHFYLIRRPDTGVVDVVFSTNASTPTLPTNYTQYRRIGSGLTNGSGQWVKFTQVGDDFLWDAAVVDVDAVNPGTSAVSRTLTVPTGVKVDAMLSVGGYNGTQFFNIAISSLDSSDQAPQASGTAALSGFSTNNVPAGTTGWTFSTFNVRTNTSAQVRSRISASGAADRIGIITRGWVDTRGRLD